MCSIWLQRSSREGDKRILRLSRSRYPKCDRAGQSTFVFNLLNVTFLNSLYCEVCFYLHSPNSHLCAIVGWGQSSWQLTAVDELCKYLCFFFICICLLIISSCNWAVHELICTYPYYISVWRLTFIQSEDKWQLVFSYSFNDHCMHIFTPNFNLQFI